MFVAPKKTAQKKKPILKKDLIYIPSITKLQRNCHCQ